jgi:Kinesin motor domain
MPVLVVLSCLNCTSRGSHHKLATQANYDIRVQLLEIYNEQLRDLLDDRNRGKKLDIRCTERSGVNVPDAIQVCHDACFVYMRKQVE